MTPSQALRAAARVAIRDAHPGDPEGYVLPVARAHQLAIPSDRERRRLLGVAREMRRRAEYLDECDVSEWMTEVPRCE